MTTEQKQYYSVMNIRGRLIPFVRDNRLVGFITFNICDDVSRFTHDHWEVIDDNPNGSICYITQLITDKHHDNCFLSHNIWKEFKGHIKSHFKNVEKIIWRRWNREKGEVDVYIKTIRR